MSENLVGALVREIARVSEIRGLTRGQAVYFASAGNPSATFTPMLAMIKIEIETAISAVESGNIEDMRQSLEALKGYEQ